MHDILDLIPGQDFGVYEFRDEEEGSVCPNGGWPKKTPECCQVGDWDKLELCAVPREWDHVHFRRLLERSVNGSIGLFSDHHESENEK